MAFPTTPPSSFSSPAIFSDRHRNHQYSTTALFSKSHTLNKSQSQFQNPNSLTRSKYADSTLCSCRRNSSDSPSPSFSSGDDRWTFPFQQFLVNVAQKLENLLNLVKNDSKGELEVNDKVRKGFNKVKDVVDGDDWDWERWLKHFNEVEDQERLILVLKAQLTHAIDKEDYEDAARLKVAIAAAATKDAVGSAMSYFETAVDDERYQDAIFMRDNAGAGLVGWWAGVSDDGNDPYGCIIRISAEHGRYVAKSYSPRQLASSTAGIPLFEIYFTLDKKGKYRQQAVYLKRKAASGMAPSVSPKPSSASGSMNKMNPSMGKTDIFSPAVEDIQDDEDIDDPELIDGFMGFQNILQDMIPGVRVRVLKVTTSGKVDQDLISKVVEQIIEEEDEEKDIDDELESTDSEDTEDGILSSSDEEKDEIDSDSGNIDNEEQNEIGIKIVVSGLVEKLAGTSPSSTSSSSSRELVRVPAKLKPKGRKSFSLCIQDDEDGQESGGGSRGSAKRKSKTQGQQNVDHVISDLVKFISQGEKIPVKVLKDVGDLISLTLNQAQNRQPLSGSTTFSRIDLPSYPDPLNGLYIGSHGPYTSEVIHLKRKFGQWQDDGGTERSSDLHFYEYVEAVKLTGDPYVPAGQVAFRAKVGKRYQLPHKGIIPEELGVVARYKGQGRLAEPGFRNPRWVDGELIILDGKFIKGGPVVGFVYWAPEYQFLVFFNRLRIQD